METEKAYEYDAFISYRHTPLDKAVADKLQRLLERYTPPKSAGMAARPEKLHIFRDVTELPIGANLSDQLRCALEKSRYLIVICSETTAQSPWCMEEIVYFKELHGGNTGRIITMVTEGEPAKVIPRELFSETRYETGPDGMEQAVTANVEPLAANVGGPSQAAVLRKLKKEFLRIAAPLLDKKFDELYNRRQRQFVRRAAAVSSLIAAGLVVFTIYTLSMLFEIQKQKDEAERNRDIAITQQGIAETQRETAERNLSDAKSLMLESAIRHAARLTGEGSVGRAAAVLANIWPNIDFSRPDAAIRAAQFRDAAFATMFHAQTQAYATVDLEGGEALALGVLSDTEAAVVTAGAIIQIDLRTGEIIHTVKADTPFIGGRVAERYAAAVTEGGILLLYDSVTRKTARSEGIVFAYQGEGLESIYIRPENEFIMTASYKTGRFDNEPDSVYYVPGDIEEVYGKLMLTFIPCDFEAFSLDESASQVFTYKTDVIYDFNGSKTSSNVSPDGRFITFINQHERMAGDIQGQSLNSDFWVLDLGVFQPGNSVETNRGDMITCFDARIDGDGIFDYRSYYITDYGLLIIDGNDRYNTTEGRTADNQRSIVYNAYSNQLLLHQNIALEGEFGDEYRLLQTNHEMTSWSEYLIYSIHREDRSSTLKLYDVYSGSFNYTSYTLPGHIYQTDIYEVGVQWILTDSSNIYYIPYIGDVVEVQTPKAPLKRFARTGKTMAAVFGDGSLMLYNLGPSPYLEGLAQADEMPYDSERSIVCYNGGRSLAFGYTGWEGAENEYGIWDVKTERLLHSFHADEDETMRINAEFTHIIARRASSDHGYSYRVIETASGETVYSYESPDPYAWFASIYFGLHGDHTAWVFRSDIGRLETIDLISGKVINTLNLANKLPTDRHGDVYYDNSLMIFSGTSGYVYSLDAGSVIMQARIDGADVDCLTVYIGEGLNALIRVELTPEYAYEMIMSSPHTPGLSDEDRAAAGLAIFYETGS